MCVARVPMSLPAAHIFWMAGVPCFRWILQQINQLAVICTLILYFFRNYGNFLIIKKESGQNTAAKCSSSWTVLTVTQPMLRTGTGILWHGVDAEKVTFQLKSHLLFSAHRCPLCLSWNGTWATFSPKSVLNIHNMPQILLSICSCFQQSWIGRFSWKPAFEKGNFSAAVAPLESPNTKKSTFQLKSRLFRPKSRLFNEKVPFPQEPA